MVMRPDVFTIYGRVVPKTPSVTIDTQRWRVTKSLLPPSNRFGRSKEKRCDHPNTETDADFAHLGCRTQVCFEISTFTKS